MTPATPGPDEKLVRAAARRIAWQISLAIALIVIMVAGLALLLAPLLHPDRFGHGPGVGAGFGGGDDDDALLRDSLVVASLIGIAIAGLLGFLIARRAVAPLGEALALQRRFVADAGHELRTPLTVLHTRAQLLARRMSATDPSRPMMDQILDDSRVLGEIVDEMLESAALATDPHRGERLNPAEVAAEVEASMQVLAAAAGITLVVVDQSDREIRGSRTALRRALTALVDNALSHTPPGGHVTIETTGDDNHVLIAVTDDGEGLPDTDAERLTERFARGPSSAQAVGGGRRFGLGLSLVREIATAHGGDFTLTGRPGTGVRAIITVPTHSAAGKD